MSDFKWGKTWNPLDLRAQVDVLKAASDAYLQNWQRSSNEVVRLRVENEKRAARERQLERDLEVAKKERDEFYAAGIQNYGVIEDASAELQTAKELILALLEYVQTKYPGEPLLCEHHQKMLAFCATPDKERRKFLENVYARDAKDFIAKRAAEGKELGKATQ